MRRRTTLGQVRVVLWLTLIALLVAPQPVQAGERQCFASGLCVENAFYAYWASHGAADVLGEPVSAALSDDNGLIVQYFERALLEWHPESPYPYQVQLARLGAWALGDNPQGSTPPGPCDEPECRYFPETNHTVRYGFLSHWSANGDYQVFGLPLTEEFAEYDAALGASRTVQYFERARFEYLGTTTLSPLGLLAWQARPWLHGRAWAAPPDYPLQPVETPSNLSIPKIGVSANIIPLGVDASGAMEAPSNAYDVGWLKINARPGQPGNAVLDGHVDYRGVGPAVFFRLRELTSGDAVWVTDAAGVRRRFVVIDVQAYRPHEAPLGRIFGPTGDVNLNLITCTGTFNSAAHDYDQRLIVYTRWDGIVW